MQVKGQDDRRAAKGKESDEPLQDQDLSVPGRVVERVEAQLVEDVKECHA